MAKESSASRRARVKFQLRDRKGRWIEMGRGVKWYSPRLGREVSGTVVGSKGRNAIVDITSEPAGVTGKPQQVSVKGTDIEVIANKASIGAPAPKAAKPKAPTEKAKLSPGQAREQARINDQSKTNNRKSSAPVADKDEDLDDLDAAPEEGPDAADLEEVDVDEDLGEDDADTDEDVDTSPTSVDDLEATIEELEAVVEEVASGDLDANEIDAKLAEEVYSVYGKDGKQYDLDVKKSDGKWNYRLKDAGAGETRALIPADDNDSVDAGAKLNAAMNPKSKAKATTAKTEETAPEAKAVPAPEAATPVKPKSDAKITSPARRSAAKQPKLVIKDLKNVKRNGNGDYESTDISEKLVERLPVGTEISSVDTGQFFVKVAPNRWAEPDGIAQKGARELKDVDMMGEGDDMIYLPGSDSNTTDATEIERLTAVLDKNAEEAQAENREYEEYVKAREEAKKQSEVTENGNYYEMSNPKLVKVSDLGVGDSFIPLAKVDGEDINALTPKKSPTDRDYSGGSPVESPSTVSIQKSTSPAVIDSINDKGEPTFKMEGVSQRKQGARNDSSSGEKASWDSTMNKDAYVVADTPENRKALADAGMEQMAEQKAETAPKPEAAEAPATPKVDSTPTADTRTDPKDMSRDELINEAGDLEGLKHEADITGMGDHQFTPDHQSRLDALDEELKTRSDSPDPVAEDKPEAAPQTDSEPVMTMTLRKGKTRSEIQMGIETQETDSRDPGLRINGTKLEVTDYENAKFTLDGPIGIAEDQLDYGDLVGKERTDTKAALAGLKKVRDAIADHEEANKPKATTEASPATPETDSAVPTDTQMSPARMTTPELIKEVTDLEIKGAKAATDSGDYVLSPEDSARRDDLRKELDTREGEAPTEVTPEVETDEGAAALAAVGVERTEPRALPGEKFAPTRQQQDVIDAVMAGKDTVVQAKAGAGKTTTLQAIAARVAEASPDKKIVYVAFNSSVQKEAEARMPGNVEARTGHSIGFGWVGKDVNDRYKSGGVELDEDVAKHIGITGTYKGDPGSDDSTLYPEDIAAAAMLTVDKFAYNAEDDINEDHLPDSMFGTSPEAKTAVIDAANKIWADVNAPDGKIKLTQDHMRKMWALSRPDFGQTGAGLRRKADMLFIDEAQDTPPVLAKVVADQKMQKVIVGDADQAIYAFSGATDFLSKAEKDIELPLNRSWRFGAPVADAGNRFLELLGSKGRVVGGGNSKLSDGKMQDADAVLVRTNAGALGEMVEEGSRGRIVGVEKKTIDKFKSAADTMDWLKSKNKGQTPIPKPQKVLPELAAYKDWSHVERENEKGDKPNLAMYVRLDGLYGSNGIRDALKNVVAVDSKSPGKSSGGIGGNLNGVQMDDNGKTTVAAGNAFMNKDDLKAVGFKFLPDPSGDLYRSGQNKGKPKKSWQATGTPEQRAAMVEAFGKRLGVGTPVATGADPVTPDVIISTAHKAKGLEWKKVRIGDDFPQPKLNKATGKMVMPDDENLRLAYVAVTRAEAELDPGSLGYVYDYTKENGGTPEPADKPAEQNEVTEPPISAADDSDFVPESDDRVADTEAEAATEAPQAPEADEVADESVPDAAPEAPEAAPEPVEAPEDTNSGPEGEAPPEPTVGGQEDIAREIGENFVPGDADETQAAMLYMAGADYNNVLRQGNTENDTLNTRIESLTGFIEKQKPLPVGTKVYRGGAKGVGEYKVGEEFSDPAFLSTSLNRDQSDLMSGSGALMEIDADGLTGLSITSVLEHESYKDVPDDLRPALNPLNREAEILMPPGTRLRIDAIDTDEGGRTIVRASAVPTLTDEAPGTPTEVSEAPDDAAPVVGLDDDGLTPAEASYAGKLQKAISDGYRTGIGNIQALQERLDEIYDRGAARQRGEDPDATPEAAPEVKPVEDKEPTTPEAEEEVVPEAEEVVEETPEPTPEAPAEAEAEPVEVVETPAEDGPQGDASDGEEVAEGGPTDLESFEATASELFSTFQDTQTTPRTPEELQDILDEEVYLLVGEDGAGYEFGLSIDDKGAWNYVLSDDDGNELERYNVVTTSPEEAGQKAFERVNGSQESETTEEAPVDPADATPEAEEETVDEADRVEPEEAPEVDPEVVPEPAPMPEVEVEEDTAPEAQTPQEAPQETPEVAPEGGTAPAEPDTRPLHPVKQKAHNYPDGTQIKAARTDELIEKTDGKWHVAGSPNKAADPMTVDTPLVVEMPKQSDDSFTPFDGNIDSLVPGDIIRTENGAQAAVIGTRNGKVGAMPHGIPPNRKALQPNTVSVDPSKITGVIKFDAPAPEEEAPATPAARTRTKTAGGAPIKDVNGDDTKIGDRVMTAVGQGEVIALRPAAGPDGSVYVLMDNGKKKTFRSNKFTNAANAELLEADDPATMEVGTQGTAEDGRKFLVGKGNKPIYKGDRVELADGRIGTVAGIYAGVKSAGVTMEDGSTTRKKVSTLNAIDYTAPEEAAPEVSEPTPEVAPEVETTVDAPEVEADVDEGPSETAFEYSDSEMSQLFQAHMEVAGFTAESFIQTLQATGSKTLMREWEEEGGASALSTLMSGEGSEKELYHSVKKLDSVIFGGIFYSDYAELPVKNAKKLRTLREQLDEIAPIYTEAHMAQLNSISEDTPGKVTDVTNYSADDVDFSGFDWTTSKFNPNSEKAQTVGDAEADMMEGVNLRSGTKVRNKKTGEYGTISALHSSQLRDGNHTVFESTGPTGEHNFVSGNWAADEIEVADTQWASEAGNFDHVADVESLAEEMSSMYPDVGFDFSGLPLDYAKEAATNISRLATKYPMLRSSLTAVRSRAMPAGVYASASRMGESTYGVDYAPSVMSLNTVGSDRARSSLRNMSDEGWLNPIAEGNEIASTVSHEMGHILENLTGEIKEEDIAEILKSLYPQYRPNVEAVYRNMFRAGILPRYPVAESALDVAELMAEAFADAELNATEARPLSKLLHQYLMERLQEG